MKAQRALNWARSNARAWLARPYSQLLIASDSANWVLDEEGREMIEIGRTLGFPAYFTERPRRALKQSIHYTSFFSLAQPGFFDSHHRIGVDYFHGKPDQDPTFRKVFESLKKNVSRLTKLRLSYSGMLPLALEAGVPADRIHRIPIGINPAFFKKQTAEGRMRARERLGIPQSAVVVGSFQKDGQGWGEGMEPKWVKGPDVFLETLGILKLKVPELFVLLTGPARGFVKEGLTRRGIPYKHFLFSNYSEIGSFYEAIDAYIVASREEGGPKSILESMISGVPIVSTKVGQAIDLVWHDVNGFLADVGDCETLAALTERVLTDSMLRNKITTNAYQTAQMQTYQAQIPEWEKYFRGFVEW